MTQTERDRYMKHILSLLVFALAFTATTAYAAFTYEIVKTGYGQSNQPVPGNDSFYKIRITEGSGDIYLSDWIDTIGDSHQTDSLKQKVIESYGYYYEDSNDENKKGAGEDLGADAIPEPIETWTVPWNGKEIIRFSYKLGTFTEGDEVEIYMKDANGSVKSNTTPSYKGGYGVNSVDQFLFYQINYDWEGAKAAMPLAALDTDDSQRVFTYGKASVVLLSGGLSVVLVFGLCSLGFYFVRRRKALAA